MYGFLLKHVLQQVLNVFSVKLMLIAFLKKTCSNGKKYVYKSRVYTHSQQRNCEQRIKYLLNFIRLQIQIVSGT